MSNITFPERPTCPFCAMLAKGELDDSSSAPFLAASEQAVAFLDSFPLNPGHTLIISRRHVPDSFALTAPERASIFGELLPLLPEVLAGRGISPDGWNVGINVGEDAGQTIGHLHVHLIPRYSGDVDYDGTDSPRGGVRWILPQRAAYWEDTPRSQEMFTGTGGLPCKDDPLCLQG
jgi:diadenosine tetraphosphate (Ap4A) HIT family hydrolase